MDKRPVDPPLSRRNLMAAVAATTAVTALPVATAIPSQAANRQGPAADRQGPAADPVNPRPFVVPALQEWDGGTGAYRLTADSRVVVHPHDAAQLLPLARQVTQEIAAVTGVELAAPRATRGTDKGSILLRLDPGARHDRGGDRYTQEGYTLQVTKDTVAVTAPAYSGVYYGTRSLLQILLRDETRSHVPAGTAQDWPNYRLRGFMLDVGRRFFTPASSATTCGSWAGSS